MSDSSPSRMRQFASRAAREDGHTLSEMLVVMAILATVLAGLGTVFVSATKAEIDQNLRFQAQQEARLALDRLRREGHCATSVATAAAPPTNRITFTLPPQCRPGVDISSSTTSSGLGNTTDPVTFSVGTIIGAFPAPPFNVIVDSENMRVTAVSGTTWVASRAQLGTAAAAHSATTLIRLGAYQVTWCTSGTGSRWALRRIEGNPAAGSCTGGTAVADYLTAQNVFTALTAASVDRRATLGISFRVDVEPADAMRVYHLKDDIVLRNSPRA